MRRVSRYPACLALLAALAVAPPAAAAAAAHPPVTAPTAPPPVTARAAALYDPQTATILYGKHADRRAHIASLTKIMTALLALRHPASQKITVRKDVVGLPQTIAGLVPGRTYTLHQLLRVLIVRSANDAAVAIADGVAGSVPAFVRRMNATAKALGLTNTRYANPNGLDLPDEYSSARDVAVLAGVAMRNPAFRALVKLRSAALPGGPTFDSLNPFLSAYPGADGVKTGFTSDARFCLAASAVHGGRRLIAVVLGEPSFAVADRDAARLLDWGFAHDPAAAVSHGKPRPAGTGSVTPPSTARPDTQPVRAAPAHTADAAQPRTAPEPRRPAARRSASPQVPVEPTLLLAAALAGALLGLASLLRARRAAERAKRRTPAR